MSMTALHRLRHSLVITAAAVLVGCADDAFGPELPAPAAALPDVVVAGAAVDLGACQNLQVPPESKLALRVYARGVQIYRWDGTDWSFVGPWALLSADPAGMSTVGTHSQGPVWESNSGSKVFGAVLQTCTPDAHAIPWLLLRGVSPEGPGIFSRVTFIQRVNTVGGKAPSDPGSFTDEEARVAYTTEYLFYRER